MLILSGHLVHTGGHVSAQTSSTSKPVSARVVRFNRDIRPILSEYCFACHGPGKSAADLRLDEFKSATADFGGYQPIKPGDPRNSELIARITSTKKFKRMPPPKTNKELSAEQIALLRTWIEQGAKYERHWAYVPPSRPKVPDVKQKDWVRNPIDAFILAKLEARGLTPSPAADRVTLLRRLSFDLTGLPPSQGDDFLTSAAADSFAKLVDRTLASPHYGERLAMYWLDLVRYADTVGYHGDQEHPIWPYRDWVINAFNDNMPFDQFTTAQLAGDLLPNATVNQKIATGYNRVLQTTHEGGAQDKEYLAIYFADRVRNLSEVWMGATVGCGQCHNHKYDPYTQKDFYRLGAFFADVKEMGAYRGPDRTPTNRPPALAVPSPLDQVEARRLTTTIEAMQAKLTATQEQQDKASEANVAALKKTLASLQKQRDMLLKRRPLTMVTESVKPRVIRVLKRGDWQDTTGAVVTPAVPEFMGTLKTKGRATRLDLANWLTSPQHPQTARVFVNRLWHLYFGQGIARTLEDNGSQGEWPTHPDLLDWLAVEFVESGWDVKHIVRLMVTSNAYQQSSLVSDRLKKLDPENRLFSRQARFRLPAEMIRDNALAVSGLLVRQMGGPPARPYQPAGYYAHLNFPKRTYKADTDNGQYRRGVYMHWQRQFLHPMLRAFDAPSREECTAHRAISNTPLAALVTLNDPTFVEAARVFAGRIIREGGPSTDDRIRWAWRELLTRSPEPRETSVLHELFDRRRAQFGKDPQSAAKLIRTGLAPVPPDIDAVELAAWTSVARALLNLNETLTRN